MSYDLTIAKDETFSAWTRFSDLADFLRATEHVKPNGDRGFVFEPSSNRWMEIDLEVGQIASFHDIIETLLQLGAHVSIQFEIVQPYVSVVRKFPQLHISLIQGRLLDGEGVMFKGETDVVVARIPAHECEPNSGVGNEPSHDPRIETPNVIITIGNP